MREPLFWDCVDESAPFGSDEGNMAYYEWRDWRVENPDAPLTDCFNWILNGRIKDYNDALASDVQIQKDVDNPEDAFLAEHFDIFTLDTTIIATALGQLMDEGVIDQSAKPYISVAIKRQRHPSIGYYDDVTLDAISRVVSEA